MAAPQLSCLLCNLLLLLWLWVLALNYIIQMKEMEGRENHAVSGSNSPTHTKSKKCLLPNYKAKNVCHLFQLIRSKVLNTQLHPKTHWRQATSEFGACNKGMSNLRKRVPRTSWLWSIMVISVGGCICASTRSKRSLVKSIHWEASLC